MHSDLIKRIEAADGPSRAMQEEYLAVLYFIASGVMHVAGMQWIAWVFFGKGILDTLCAIAVWILQRHAAALRAQGGSHD